MRHLTPLLYLAELEENIPRPARFGRVQITLSALRTKERSCPPTNGEERFQDDFVPQKITVIRRRKNPVLSQEEFDYEKSPPFPKPTPHTPFKGRGERRASLLLILVSNLLHPDPLRAASLLGCIERSYIPPLRISKISPSIKRRGLLLLRAGAPDAGYEVTRNRTEGPSSCTVQSRGQDMELIEGGSFASISALLSMTFRASERPNSLRTEGFVFFPPTAPGIFLSTVSSFSRLRGPVQEAMHLEIHKEEGFKPSLFELCQTHPMDPLGGPSRKARPGNGLSCFSSRTAGGSFFLLLGLSACASRAIGALLSYYLLDGFPRSDRPRRYFPTQMEKAVSHRDVDSFLVPVISYLCPFIHIDELIQGSVRVVPATGGEHLSIRSRAITGSLITPRATSIYQT
eukprot:Gb_18121 [translate_table: standard]